MSENVDKKQEPRVILFFHLKTGTVMRSPVIERSLASRVIGTFYRISNRKPTDVVDPEDISMDSLVSLNFTEIPSSKMFSALVVRWSDVVAVCMEEWVDIPCEKGE